MEVDGQLHVTTALSLRKEKPLPFSWEADWAPEPVWKRLGRDRIPSISLLEMEPW